MTSPRDPQAGKDHTTHLVCIMSFLPNNKVVAEGRWDVQQHFPVLGLARQSGISQWLNTVANGYDKITGQYAPVSCFVTDVLPCETGNGG